MVQHRIVTKIVSTLQLIMVNHGHTVKKIVSWSNVTFWQPWASMVKHGATLHRDKYCLNMKINDGQAWPTIVQRRIVTKIMPIWKSFMLNHGQKYLF